jgi:hypothetical protein
LATYTRLMPKMSRAVSAAALAAIGMFCSAGACAEVKPPRYVDLTAHFSRFVDETAGLADAERVALFHERMDALLPGFYEPRFGATPAQYDARIARELKHFTELRPRYERVQREFPAAFDAGIRHFRKEFPGFTPNVPVYLLHSLGEMDGGTRELQGKIHLIFGADMIAQIHDARTLTPFLDHELFHVEHGKYFPECGEVWCTLWAEGLATFAAKVMNPGADDQQLLLTTPEPIRPAVDATWPAAVCFVRGKLDSAAENDLSALFQGGADSGGFPNRFGYYVGLRIAEEAGGGHSLAALSRMKPSQAKAAQTASIDRLIQKAGGCR